MTIFKLLPFLITIVLLYIITTKIVYPLIFDKPPRKRKISEPKPEKPDKETENKTTK